jgi:phosphoribosylformylglycinamidine synthase
MNREKIRVCILRTAGTNCDGETERAFKYLGVKAETLRFTKISDDLDEFDAIVLPGGFSYGDYVRAGAIWGKEIHVKLGERFQEFVDGGKPVLGICNGFQVLVESGYLPAFHGVSERPEMSLATNISSRYECRWVSEDDYLYLKHENSGSCVFTRKIRRDTLLRIPIGHGEGRVIFPKEEEDSYLKRLIDNDQLVFRYARSDGNYPDGEYPYNPNGSFFDIAGICNPRGNVLGLMPHPERAFFGWQLPDYYRLVDKPDYGDGKLIFESVIEYIEENF